MFTRTLRRFSNKVLDEKANLITKKTFDIFNPREAFRTIYRMDQHVALYNSKMAHLKDIDNPEKLLEYIRALRAMEDYKTAHSLCSLNAEKLNSIAKGAGGFLSSRKVPFDLKKLQAQYNAELKLLDKEVNPIFLNKIKLYGLVVIAGLLLITHTNFFSRLISQELIYIDPSGELRRYLLPNYDELKKQGQSIKKDKGDDKDIMFKDVIGIDEYKEELLELVDFLQKPERYENMGAYIPRGILLAGKPGTGKTMLAKAVANESNCSFYYASGAEFDQIFVGYGAKKVRELFAKAKMNQPAIIFIDEIDSVGNKRSNSSSDTINQLLTEMDGFKKNERIVVIGATNLPDVIDPALKRPGRFDKTIDIPLPDVKGRTKLFEYYLSKVRHDNKTSAEYLAKKTSGFSGAMIKNYVNIAICNAILRGQQQAENKDFDVALDKVLIGTQKRDTNQEKEQKKRTAIYEAGKALASLILPEVDPVYKVSILPKGDKISGTVTKSMEDKLSMNKQQLSSMIMLALAGRVSESMFFNSVSTRSSADYLKASKILIAYHRKMAMDESLSLISADKDELSSEYNHLLEKRSEELLASLFAECTRLMKPHYSKINKISVELINKETLTSEQIKELIKL